MICRTCFIRILSGMVIFSSFILLSFCPAIPAGENYLLNPGFEEGGTATDNWITFSPAASGVSFFWDSTVSYQGEKSVSIESGERSIGMWRQVVPASAGTVYTLAGCLNLENVNEAGYCTLQVVFRDSANRLLEMVDFREHRGTIEWISDFPYSIYTVAPESTARAEVNLVLQGPGKVWFDTVHFGPAETGIISGRVPASGPSGGSPGSTSEPLPIPLSAVILTAAAMTQPASFADPPASGRSVASPVFTSERPAISR